LELFDNKIIINDAHIHLGKSSEINRSLQIDDILRLKDKQRLGNLMLMSLDLDIEINNKTIIELCERFPFIFGLLWIQKSKLSENIDLFEKMLGNSRVIGAKFHGSFENTPVSSSVYSPLMKVLNEKEAILLIHAGRYKDASLESNTSYLHAIELAKSYPKIKVILAHMGGTDTSIIKRAVQDSKDIPNIYFDTSGITTPYIIEYATRVIDVKRILFGSDEPWCSFMSMYYNIIDSQITKEDKEAILSENFNKLILEH